MEKEYLSTIWPVLYFEADWPSKSYKFDLGVQLIKADKTTLEDIAGIDSPAYMTNISGFDHIHQNTQWFLKIHRPEVYEHISVNEIGMSFVGSLQNSIIESFLMCLKLIRSTEAICPFAFPAEIHEDTIDEINTNDDFYGINSDKPPVYLPETFKIDDLQLLTDLWSALIKLRKLDFWKKLIGTEEFFAACDKKAGEDATEKMVDFFVTHEYYADVSEEEKKKARKQWTNSIKEAINKGQAGEFWKDFYRDSFPEVFMEKQEEVFSNRTRIGRALNLFFEGLHLPLQHSFLSMCLALETLYTVEEAEITYQFATRLANITGKTFAQRKDIFERARNAYRGRSNIVHGRKSIETIDSNILKDSFLFARQSLQHILLDSTLLKLYSDPITSDKTRDPHKAVKAINEYFRDLDLR